MSFLQNIKRIVCCSSDRLYPNPYNFNFGQPADSIRNTTDFQSNFVRTSKYRWYTFIPHSLILQFQRLANIYFLVIAIMQTIPAISPLGPLTAWAPLIVVLGISMLRQGYEDYQRYRSDQNLNFEQKTKVIQNDNIVEIQWSDVKVGDICYVEQDERFAADLILLSSSIQSGNAFIETASLDGQKNLKPRNAFKETQQFNSLSKLRQFKGQWLGILPDKELHQFKSTMNFGSSRIQFSKDKQLLYREARLKNTAWIYGLVIYTGKNSKIMMNSGQTASKMSQIQRKVNYILLFILLIQICLCIITATLAGVFIDNHRSTDTYILWGSYSNVADGFLLFCTYLVLLNTMIPISLIVSIQIVKMSQSYFIDNDRLMFSQFRNRGPTVRSASLNEQLGQIQYIFTDKTGTLTTNRMQFKIALIGHKYFGDIGLIANDPSIPPQKQYGFHDDSLVQLLSKGTNNQYINDIVIKNKDGTFCQQIKSLKQLAHQYLTALAITHEVIVAKDKDGKAKFQGPSPDEVTLVDAAKQMRYEFICSTQASLQISVNNKPKQFELLQTFSFSSDRKRMSVIVRQNGVIKMYTKGADNIIGSRLAEKNINIDYELDGFARIGLRTLMIAMRFISAEEYNQYKRKVSLLPLQNKEKAMEPLISDLEKDLYLLGATAVLDRLQDEVPQTIRDLIRANIKVWMLTGDKMQTAENIAKSCNLIQPNFKVLRYICKDKDTEKIHQHFTELINSAKRYGEQDFKVSLLIEGPDLSPIMGVDSSEKDLAQLSLFCQSVVCCRLLPSQKADMVRVVREKLNKITLSIGDGANDVPMINMAHIGVGLYGEEGMGAVLASDYALPEFRMLWRLLLVHGRWNYMRISEMILYFFYKNMLFTIPQFLFSFYCGYSGQTIFDDLYISLYNLIFTSIPLIIRAIFQQDVYYVHSVKNEDHQPIPNISASIIRPHVLSHINSQFLPKQYEMNKYLYRLFPKMYFVGQQNCIFNYSNFFFWILQGIAEAVLIFMFSIYILSTPSFSRSGYSTDLWIVSLTIFSSVIAVVTFKLSTHTKFWSLMLIFSIMVLSLGLYVAYMWISNYFFNSDVLYTSQMFYTSGQTYFIVLFCICFILFVDGVVLSIDFQRAGIISQLRQIVSKEKEDSVANYQRNSVKISVQTVPQRS